MTHQSLVRRPTWALRLVLRLSAATTSGGGACRLAQPAVTLLGLSSLTSSLHQLT